VSRVWSRVSELHRRSCGKCLKGFQREKKPLRALNHRKQSAPERKFYRHFPEKGGPNGSPKEKSRGKGLKSLKGNPFKKQAGFRF